MECSQLPAIWQEFVPWLHSPLSFSTVSYWNHSLVSPNRARRRTRDKTGHACHPEHGVGWREDLEGQTGCIPHMWVVSYKITDHSNLIAIAGTWRNKWLVLTWQIQETWGQNWYLSWASKVDLNFHGEYEVSIGEEPRKMEKFITNGKKTQKVR